MSFERIKNGQCPNGCGDLTVLKKPINTFQAMPMELFDIVIEYQERHPDEGEVLQQIMDQTNIVGLCAECGFCLQTTGSQSVESSMPKEETT